MSVPTVKPPSRRKPTRLLIASPDHNADILYAGKFWAPDAYLLLIENGRSTALLSDLEIDRARQQAGGIDEFVPLSGFVREHKAYFKTDGEKTMPPFPKIAAHFLRQRGVRRAVVPADFPLGLAETIRSAGVALKPVVKGHFWPAREHKTPEELTLIRRALGITGAGLARAVEVLTAAEVSAKKILRWGGGPLTSERLRAEIDSAVLHAGGRPGDTIVAGGEQACDPHERGHGPLRAGELIILDVFPRDARSGYFGDLTRTVIKGPATDAQRQLWDTVLAGQTFAIEGLRAGQNGVELHQSLKKLFADRGYPTEQRDGRHVGFFHGTGHGLGLELHEDPRYNRTTRFLPGQVFTVEPGLYYPGLGGVRIEDVAVVTEDGRPAEVLSDFPNRLEL